MSDLEAFVLAYARANGGIVEPPVYGAYDVLLPEAEAGRMGVPAFQRLTFADDPPDGVTHLGYGHPLVDQMVESARTMPACTRLYINEVRLDKRGLADLAVKELAFPNARLSQAPRAAEARALYHYLQVNFTAALITDEKREQLISVWLDAQSGAAVEDPAWASHVPLEDACRQPDLPVASLAWLPEHALTSPQALAGLIERAAQAAVVPLADAIARLQSRAARHLELDRVRLEQYYDEMEADLAGRLQRSTDDSRRAALDARLEAVRADRAAKLADVVAKYRLRLDLEPINVAVIAQPKIQLAVEIKNRHASVERTVVWDPLRHLLQPLLCDVCLRPGTKLMLCAGGHLVCADPACRAPQCTDCTRFYCRKCAAELTACVVCDRPVCRHSQVLCPECGRGTCREHARLCHAADGEPRRITDPAPPPTPPPVPIAAPSTTDKAPAPTRRPARGRVTRKPETKAKPAARRPVARPVPEYSALRVEVFIEPREPIVAAVVFKPRGRVVIAHRVWVLEEDGIAVGCECEKGSDCAADRKVFPPATVGMVDRQMGYEIMRLCSEYGIAPRHIAYALGTGHGNVRKVPGLKLAGPWVDEAVLSAARAVFKSRYGR